MGESNILPSRTIRSSRIVTALLLVALVLLLQVTRILPYDGSFRSSLVVYVASPAIALTIPLLVWQLFRPTRLRLDVEGFVVDGGLKRDVPKTAWRDVDHFLLYSPSRRAGWFGLMIGYNLLPSARSTTVTAQLARRVAGIDGSLGGNWEISQEQLLAMLENCRRTATALDPRTAAPRSG